MKMWIWYGVSAGILSAVLIYIILKLKKKGISDTVSKLMELERYDEALQVLSENQRLLRKEFYYISKMECLNSLGEYKSCIVESRRALNKLGKQAQVYKTLAQAYYWSKEYEKAAQAMDKSIALSDREDFEAYKFKAVYLWHGVKVQEALEALDKAFELGLDDDYFWLLRGKMNYKLGNFEEAVNNYNKYLETSPDNIHAIRELSTTYFVLSRYDECIKMVNRVLELKPEDNSLNCELGKAYYYSGKLEEAMDCFDKVIEMDDSLSESYYFICKIYLKYNCVEDVFRYLKKAVQLDEAYRLKAYKDEDFDNLRFFSFFRDLIINPVEETSEVDVAATKVRKIGD